MEVNKKPAAKAAAKINIKKLETLIKAGKMLLRWLYLIALLSFIIFSYFIWNRYVQNAEWSEQQKKDYINKQAVFSFDKNAFQKATDFLAKRKENLQSGQKFSGKDIYYPEGF
jgi:hypothetical protein